MQRRALMAAVIAVLGMIPVSPAAQPAFLASPGPEWVSVATTDDSIFWVHAATRSRSGSTAGIWVINNFQTLQPAPANSHGSYQSTRGFHEYNCVSRQIRASDISWHPGLNAGGRSLYSVYEPAAWIRVAPGSVFALIMNFACGR